jgi:serine/threonine protein kinase
MLIAVLLCSALMGAVSIPSLSGEVKLADFGLARTFPSHCPPKQHVGGAVGRCSRSSAVPMTLKVVTLWYRAPELLLGMHAW